MPNICPEILTRFAQTDSNMGISTSPADLPVETAETYPGINSQSAEAIGVHTPDDILQKAPDVVH